MISGYFKANLPFVNLKIGGRLAPFLIDTGFNGQIMLPKELIKELELKRMGFGRFITASGEIGQAQLFIADLELFDEISVEVSETDMIFGILGMGLLRKFKLTVDSTNNLLNIEKI